MSINRPRSIFLSIFAASTLFLSATVAWSANESSPAALEQGQAPEIVGCPFSLDNRPEQARVVLQIINDVFHKWEEFDIGPNRACLVLMKPEERLLSAPEARNLLSQSAKWTEQTPDSQYQQTLSPQDPQLTLPPAMPPIPYGIRPESDGPDTEAEPPPIADDADSSSTIAPITGGTYTPEVVIGSDDRVRVASFSAVTKYPWWVIGYQSNTYPNNNGYRCTAFLVGPRMALTNGHCVYSSSNGGYAKSMSLAPAQTQASAGASVVRPYGTRNACYWRTNKQYIDTGDTPYDYAAMFFKESFSATGITTYMPLVFDFTPDSVNTAGYPGVAQGQSTQDMWHSYDGTNVRVEERVLIHTADTSGGQSGSPLWQYNSPSTRRIVALHSFGNSGAGYNGGPRLVSENQGVIENWMANQANYCGSSSSNNVIVPPMQLLLLSQ